jgi:adenylosuccinate synthase
MLQGATEIALTNLDVLSYLDEIPVCKEYELDGQRIVDFPVSSQLDDATPVLHSVPGWKSDITHIRAFKDLPEQAQSYVHLIESMIGIPIHRISVGPHRKQMFKKIEKEVF